MTIYLAEYFDGRFVVKKSRNNISIIGGVLFTYNNPVTVAYGGVNHRIPFDAKHEKLPTAHELAGERENILNGLLSRNRTTSSDATYEGHGNHILIAHLKCRQLRKMG